MASGQARASDPASRVAAVVELVEALWQFGSILALPAESFALAPGYLHESPVAWSVLSKSRMPTAHASGYFVDTNEEIFKKLLDDEEFKDAVADFYRKKVYDRLREPT